MDGFTLEIRGYSAAAPTAARSLFLLLLADVDSIVFPTDVVRTVLALIDSCFDVEAGTFRHHFGGPSLAWPLGVAALSDNDVLVCDNTQVYSVNVSSGTATSIFLVAVEVSDIIVLKDRTLAAVSCADSVRVFRIIDGNVQWSCHEILSKPGSLVEFGDNRLAVCCQREVMVVDQRGVRVQAFKDSDMNITQPCGICMADDETFAITDFSCTTAAVHLISCVDGKPICCFGSQPHGPFPRYLPMDLGIFDGPNGITLLAPGVLGVVDMSHKRLQIVQTDGTFLRFIELSGCERVCRFGATVIVSDATHQRLSFLM